MQITIDPTNRDQVKLLSKLTSLLEEASKICDQINGAKTVSKQVNLPLGEVAGRNGHTWGGSHRFVAGSRKTNLDLAEKILKETGKPMHVIDILNHMVEAGSNLTKGNTVAVYLKADKRFEKGQKRGFWKLSGRSPE